MSIQAECAALQKIPMFQDVEIAKLRLFALSGQRMSYEAGDVIFQQGDPAEAIYVILDGIVDVIRESDSGRVRLAQIDEGHMFGETGVLCDSPRSATIEAASPVCVLQIDRHTFNEVARDVPQLSLAIARELARRLEFMNQQLTERANA